MPARKKTPVGPVEDARCEAPVKAVRPLSGLFALGEIFLVSPEDWLDYGRRGTGHLAFVRVDNPAGLRRLADRPATNKPANDEAAAAAVDCGVWPGHLPYDYTCADVESLVAKREPIVAVMRDYLGDKTPATWPPLPKKIPIPPAEDAPPESVPDPEPAPEDSAQ